jgi:hypothetical protein
MGCRPDGLVSDSHDFSAETGTWAIGPAVVVVKMTGPFVLGGLINQLWPLSDAGDGPLGVNYHYNVERPDGAAAQQLRFVVTLFFPK